MPPALEMSVLNMSVVDFDVPQEKSAFAFPGRGKAPKVGRRGGRRSTGGFPFLPRGFLALCMYVCCGWVGVYVCGRWSVLVFLVGGMCVFK